MMMIPITHSVMPSGPYTESCSIVVLLYSCLLLASYTYYCCYYCHAYYCYQYYYCYFYGPNLSFSITSKRDDLPDQVWILKIAAVNEYENSCSAMNISALSETVWVSIYLTSRFPFRFGRTLPLDHQHHKFPMVWQFLQTLNSVNWNSRGYCMTYQLTWGLNIALVSQRVSEI